MTNPGGLTDLAGALDEAVDLIKNRKDQSRGVLVFLATDGLNNDLSDPANADRVATWRMSQFVISGIPPETRRRPPRTVDTQRQGRGDHRHVEARVGRDVQQ